MTTSARSYLTAGIAVVGAGAIVLTPVQPLSTTLDPLPKKAISELAVGLAAAVTPVDPIQNLIDVITATGENLGTLIGNWATGVFVDGTFPFPPNTDMNGNLGWRTGGYATGVPFPLIDQVATNLLTYISELPDIGAIVGQIIGNLGGFLGAPFAAGVNQTARTPNGNQSNYYNQNVNGDVDFVFINLQSYSQRDVGAILPILAGDSYAGIAPLVEFATTPISGLLVGAIGPIVAPVLAVVNGISNAFALLGESNLAGALTELINLPVNAISAFLNGGPTLDLKPLLGLLNVTLPPSFTNVGLKMGGLLSPGGVAFDAFTTTWSGSLAPGLPVGPIGALAGLNNYLANSIVVPPAAVEVAAAVKSPAPAAEAVRVEPAAAEPEVAKAEVADPVTEPEQQVADEADTTPAAPRTSRAGRGVGASSGDDRAGASTPKRPARGAASRG